MKTQIIQLGPKDDTISVRDKLGWSQARRILLVWPRYGRPLLRKLDLNLVVRKANRLGVQLAIATNDTQTRFHASQLGIPVYATSRLAQEAQWNSGRQTNKELVNHTHRETLDNMRIALQPSTPVWIAHPISRITCLVVSALAVFTLVITLLPSASVKLSPLIESQSMVFNVLADPSSSMINYSLGSLPTYAREATVEGSDITAVTGSVFIPDKPASGSLRFTNISDYAATIPTGTIVYSAGDDPIRFITTTPDETSIESWDSVLLPAQALVPGISGNLAEDELVNIEGRLGQVLVVTNPEEMSGGSEVAAPSPTAHDLINIRQRLIDRLMQKAVTQLQSGLPKEDYLIIPSVTRTEILTEGVFPQVGEPGNQIELTLNLRVQAQVVSKTSLHSLVNPIMDTLTPNGYTYQDNSLQVSPVSLPTLLGDGKFGWSIRATRLLQAQIPTEQTIQLVVGRSKTRATEVLASVLPISKPAIIQLFPTWWPRMPFLPMRIDVSTGGIQ